MRERMLQLYEQELGYLRRSGAEFARLYPRVAGRLLLEPTKCDDPHVERLLEGFAFLASRIHLKLEDDFSELPEALLGMLHPQYTRPIPSMSLVEFQLDPDQGAATAGTLVPRESLLYHTRAPGASSCRFRTCYDTTLWPLRVVAARWVSPHELRPALSSTEAVAALSVRLECFPGATFSGLPLESLRLHLSAEPQLAATLYELLLNSCTEVVVRDAAGAGEPVVLPPGAVQPVGFAPDESLLPVPQRAFLGYQLLLDYFTFPEKYLFLDLGGLEAARGRGLGEAVEVVFLVRAFERAERGAMLRAAVGAETVRLGCSPVVNLFPQTSEPISVSPREHEHLVVADARRRETTGIFSVDRIVSGGPGLRLEPMYSYRHGADGAGSTVSWLATRRAAGLGTGEETGIYLSFVDPAGRAAHPDVEAVTAHLTCHNGELPSRLSFGDPEGDFQLSGGGPIGKIRALVHPTPLISPPLGRPQLWRLVSQLSLNHVSLLDGGAGALRELLRLHNPGDSSAGDRQIAGILEASASPCHGRIHGPHGISFARGKRVEVLCDEDHFAGGGVFLLASVLERFLGLYVSLNSFSRLTVRTRQRREALRTWAPRAGWKSLL